MALLVTGLRRMKPTGSWRRKCCSNSIQTKLLLLLILGFLSASLFVTYVGHSASCQQTKKTNHVINTQSYPTERDWTLSHIIPAARSVLQQQPLLVTFINDGYLPLTYNWLCHTKRFPGLHANILFFTVNESTRSHLRQSWPTIRSEVLNRDDINLSGNLVFSTAGYLRLMAVRTKALNELLQSGLNVVLFDADIIWFDNPLQDFFSLANKHDLDLVGTKPSEKDIICGAFIYFRNTLRTREVWAEVTRQMILLETRIESLDRNGSVPEREHEQAFLSNLLMHHYHGVRYGLVDFNMTVADGKWYEMDDHKREAIRPKAIHNNFIHTNMEKVKRFQDFGHWVLNSDNSCDDGKVDEMVSSWFKRM